jgi:hypothetical protein
MPLSPTAVNRYTEGATVDASNVAMRAGCDSVLHTTTVQADGRLGACCGLGMRLIPELQIGNVGDTPLPRQTKLRERIFLSVGLGSRGPSAS